MDYNFDNIVHHDCGSELLRPNLSSLWDIVTTTDSATKVIPQKDFRELVEPMATRIAVVIKTKSGDTRCSMGMPMHLNIEPISYTFYELLPSQWYF